MTQANSPDYLSELETISVRGAKEHNLKNVNLDIKRDKLTVITGLSGSGKSSLAFDTLYAEGQRRYVECLSPYAKQYLGMMKKPDVDLVQGLSPAISIEQKTLGTNPRSTVGTVTEIYDYIRLLFAKIGTQYCVDSGQPVVKKTTEQLVIDIYKDYPDERVAILAPLVRGRKGHYKELFATLLKTGFTKVRVDGEIKDLSPGMQLQRYKIHDIELVVDRLTIDKENEERFERSFKLALKKGDNIALLYFPERKGEEQIRMYSTEYVSPDTGKTYMPPSPNMFSFNSPYGACGECQGLGEVKSFEPALMIGSEDKSLSKAALETADPKKHKVIYRQVESFSKAVGINVKQPWKELSDEQKELIFYGAEGKNLESVHKMASGRSITFKHSYPGLIAILNQRYENVDTSSSRKFLENYMSTSVCPTCNGKRLKIENLHILIDGKDISDVTDQDIESSIKYFKSLLKKLDDRQKALGTLIIKEIIGRLEFLLDVGLDYLTLGRSAKTLSGGESQRIRLASQIGSRLVGIMYVLDEPSIGLHQHDNNKLIASLKKLRDLGNTLIVVEHDKAMIEESDEFIDFGPGAGINGGQVVFQGIPRELNNATLDNSLTAQYLTGKQKIEYRKERREGKGKYLTIKGCTGNNLQNVDLSIPLGKAIGITGMSGSGKSTLINDTLVPILSKHFYRSLRKPMQYKSIEGLEEIDKIIEIDQAPIGRTPRSNPATYTGMFSLIRNFFTQLPESKVRGYKAGRFSFNGLGGRCEECQGAGMTKIEMNFLPNVYVTCPVCDGKRYNNETLQVHFKGKSIADVLDLDVSEALDFFRDIPNIYRKLKTLDNVGLGYIKLGQQAPTLSGGEAQRVKLATELSKRQTGKTIYFLDEPTTGLHFHDIKLLIKMIDELVDKGNTVIVIEHNLDVVKCMDHIIDLGPMGGSKGGKIIAEGTPEEIVKKKASLTGRYLKDEL
ncbi:MAG: excinuclease ABC subunit UvrA [Candidatus Kapaibacteriales bacterium]